MYRVYCILIAISGLTAAMGLHFGELAPPQGHETFLIPFSWAMFLGGLLSFRESHPRLDWE